MATAGDQSMQTKHLDPDKLESYEDWEGNNAAFMCPMCGKIFIVSQIIHHEKRKCPNCNKSTAYCTGGRLTGGKAYIEW